jgi:hypothetical protein
MVREKGLEPSPLAGPDPKSGVSAISPLAQRKRAAATYQSGFHLRKHPVFNLSASSDFSASHLVNHLAHESCILFGFLRFLFEIGACSG